MILDSISMSFLPGTKVGMVGPNNAGKSSILKTMAGLGELSNSEARPTTGCTVGIFEQEPELDKSKIVIENARMGIGETYLKSQHFNEIPEEMVDPDVDFSSLTEEIGTLQDALGAVNAWGIGSRSE